MTRASFDALVMRLAESTTTFSERELLEPSHWCLGEDARLREDLRFRETPWGRWMLAEDLFGNEAIYRWLIAEKRSTVALDDALKHAGEAFGRRCVFCSADPRFVLRQDQIQLAASELSRQPVVEDTVGDLEKYRTHLPLHSLKAVAASSPAGEWGKRAQDQVIATLGWVRVSIPGRRLNDRMFIAAIEGHSMDDGKSGLVDGGYAVFELWPSGSRQNMSVLVRGAFSDTETGSYAVKKYVADQRDAEGRHNKISLVSLNPDKKRYPDIDLQPDEDESVTVVARVIHALSAGDYEQRPKTRRREGRRNLEGPAALQEQADRLERRVAAFFEGGASVDEDDEREIPITGWMTRLVCLEPAAGGPHLEIGPLEGLPLFVKKLRVVGQSGWDNIVLAANARVRPTRLPVPPGSGPWHWEIVGHEGDEDLGVEKLRLDGIDAGSALVFRADADGVGHPMHGNTLGSGQAYWILLPPGVGDASLGTELYPGQGGSWRILSVDTAATLSPADHEALTSLGLELGGACPRLDWVNAIASTWRMNRRGERWPVFEAGDEIFLRATGVSVEDGDSPMLFLHGPSGTERLPMTGSGLVSLGSPPTGRWTCALLHTRTAIPGAVSFFEVAENSTEQIPPHWSVDTTAGLSALQITAPPGWPVSLGWRVLREEPIGVVHADSDGRIDLEHVRDQLQERLRRTRVADLIVDAGELGRRDFPHHASVPMHEIQRRLDSLRQQRAALVQASMGQWLTLLPLWFKPMVELLGYGMEPLSRMVGPATQAEAPHGITTLLLTVDERTSGGVKRTPSRVLLLTTDLEAALSSHRDSIDAICTELQLRDAIVTDGLRWTAHRRGLRLRHRVWHLGEALDVTLMEDLLTQLGEGIG